MQIDTSTGAADQRTIDARTLMLKIDSSRPRVRR